MAPAPFWREGKNGANRVTAYRIKEVSIKKSENLRLVLGCFAQFPHNMEIPIIMLTDSQK